jgi:hypothetical protein
MRVVLTVGVLALGLALTACENFDPTDIFDAEIFNTKKKLPGERIPVFPQGTPGVPQGVPAELVKGYQPAPEAAAAQAAPQAAGQAAPKEANAAESAEAKPKPKPKPKPKVVAKPPDPPATGSVRAPAPSAEANAQQTQAAPAASPWPNSPQPSGGIAWPDPPAQR